MTKTGWAARSATERNESLPILTADAPENSHNREKGDRREGEGGGGEVVSSSSFGAMFGLVAFYAFLHVYTIAIAESAGAYPRGFNSR